MRARRGSATAGSWTRALASDSRCFIPRESVLTSASALSSRSTRASRSVRGRAGPRGPEPLGGGEEVEILGGRDALVDTEEVRHVADVAPNRQRVTWPGRSTTTWTRPPSRSSREVMMRIDVVLPAPLGPMRPSTDPSGTSRSASRRAWTLPYRFSTEANSTITPSTRVRTAASVPGRRRTARCPPPTPAATSPHPPRHGGWRRSTAPTRKAPTGPDESQISTASNWPLVAPTAAASGMPCGTR